jgi:hypothetical protein
MASMKEKTIGQKIAVAVISELLGVSEQTAWTKYVRPLPIAGWWEQAGEKLLRQAAERSQNPNQ